MKFTKIKSPYLSRAVSFTYSDKYLVSVTGAKATVLTRNLEYVTEVSKLRHVYDGEISPDETKLLLPSYNNRQVWLFSIKDEECKKILTEEDLVIYDGWSSWSSDGNSFYLLVSGYDVKTDTTTSFVRRYNLCGTYVDLYRNECFLKSIHSLKSVGKQLICGTEFTPTHSKHFLLWYDEKTEKIQRVDLPEYDNWVYRIAIYEAWREVHIYREHSNIVCDFEGNIKDTADKKDLEITELLNVPMPKKLAEKLTDIRIVKAGTALHHLYVGTSTGLFLIDSDNGNILARVNIKCGVDAIKLLTSDTVMIDTLHGVCFYRVE